MEIVFKLEGKALSDPKVISLIKELNEAIKKAETPAKVESKEVEVAAVEVKKAEESATPTTVPCSGHECAPQAKEVNPPPLPNVVPPPFIPPQQQYAPAVQVNTGEMFNMIGGAINAMAPILTAVASNMSQQQHQQPPPSQRQAPTFHQQPAAQPQVQVHAFNENDILGVLRAMGMLQ